jgi:hypothetical protein
VASFNEHNLLYFVVSASLIASVKKCACILSIIIFRYLLCFFTPDIDGG